MTWCQSFSGCCSSDVMPIFKMNGMHWMALVRCFDDGLYLSPDAFGIAKDAALSLLIAGLRFKRSVFFGSQKIEFGRLLCGVAS